MLFHGQNIVEFSGANYSPDAWRPGSTIPYQNYVDEAIYFTSDTAVVDSFRTKFDDQWIDPAGWTDYANITTPPARSYAIFPKDPSLNFPPWENFRTRSVDAFKAEQRKIDAIMYRITDQAHTDDDHRGRCPRRAGPADHRAEAVPRMRAASGIRGMSTGCTWPASRSSTAPTPA